VRLCPHSLTDENAKISAEAQDWRAKFEEKSRQKRKLYELYTAVKQKGMSGAKALRWVMCLCNIAEHAGVPMSPAPYHNDPDMMRSPASRTSAPLSQSAPLQQTSQSQQQPTQSAVSSCSGMQL
jgi:hypothetical protein